MLRQLPSGKTYMRRLLSLRFYPNEDTEENYWCLSGMWAWHKSVGILASLCLGRQWCRFCVQDAFLESSIPGDFEQLDLRFMERHCLPLCRKDRERERDKQTDRQTDGHIYSGGFYRFDDSILFSFHWLCGKKNHPVLFLSRMAVAFHSRVWHWSYLWLRKCAWQVQVPLAFKIQTCISKFLDNSRSYWNHTAILHVLICLLNLQFA